jgi:hypothetical protein
MPPSQAKSAHDRRYAKIKDQAVQRQLVSLIESIAANEA